MTRREHLGAAPEGARREDPRPRLAAESPSPLPERGVRGVPRGPLHRHAAAAAAALAVVLSFAGVFQHGLWAPDEPREAEIGREMLLSGGSAIPRLGGEPFLEKPPLFPWLMALSYRAFGVSAAAARLPAAIFGVGSMLVAFALGRRGGGRLAGLLSVLVLGTAAKFAEVGHMSVNDTALTFFVAAGHLALLVGRDRWRNGRRSPALATAGACAALAFLTKGAVGPLLLAAPPLAAALAMKERAFLRFALPRAAGWAALFFLATGLPWLLSLAAHGAWPLVRSYLVDTTIGRSVPGLGAEFGHAHGPLYYLETVPVDFLPWSLALPALLASGILRKTWHGGRTRCLSLIVAAGLVLLTLPATKRGLYALPLYPAAAALVGAWLARAGTRLGSRVDRATLGTIGALVGALSVAVGLLGLAGPALSGGGTRRAASTAAEALVLLRERRTPAEWRLAGGVVLAAGLAVLAGLHSSRRRPTSRLAAAASVGVLAVWLAWYAALQPFVDPLKEMGPRTRALAGRVPKGEPLLGLSLDETTRAIVPFYTGRIVRSVNRPAEALAELAAGPSRHLFVMDGGADRLDLSERERLRLVAREGIALRRGLSLYAWVPPP